MADLRIIKRELGPKWQQIVTEYGVDPQLLDGKHHACPVCREGEDRFRIMDRRTGAYYCEWCRSSTNGRGDWLDLIAGVTGMSIGQIARELSDRFDLQSGSPPPRNDHLGRARALWESSRSAAGTLAEDYLASRGITVCPPELRFHAAVFEPETREKFPAMLAPVSDYRGELVTVHRTFLARNGTKAKIQSPKKLMPVLRGATKGAGIRMLNRTGAGTVCVAEGIETALALPMLPMCAGQGWPVVSTISAHGMAYWRPPAGVRRVKIFSDFDENAVGQAAAWTLCARLRKLGLDVPDPFVPPAPGDWLDAALVLPPFDATGRGAEKN